MTFTPKQRDVLIHRVARAVLWSHALVHERDNANRIARAVVDELELSGFTAGTQRRAIERVISNIEDVA